MCIYIYDNDLYYQVSLSACTDSQIAWESNASMTQVCQDDYRITTVGS